MLVLLSSFPYPFPFYFIAKISFSYDTSKYSATYLLPVLVYLFHQLAGLCVQFVELSMYLGHALVEVNAIVLLGRHAYVCAGCKTIVLLGYLVDGSNLAQSGNVLIDAFIAELADKPLAVINDGDDGLQDTDKVVALLPHRLDVTLLQVLCGCVHAVLCLLD